MDSVRSHPRWYAAAAALLTGLFLYFGSGLDTIPALTWLAPLPVLLVAPHLTKRLTALTAFIGWSLGLANLWSYLLTDLDFLVLLAGVFTLTVLLFRALAVRRRYLLAAIVAPATYAQQIEAAAAKGAQVVVLPEKFIDVDASALPDLQRRLQKIATGSKVELVAGLTVFGDHGKDYNRALVLHPAGGVPVSYDKHHLIPGIEPYEPGDHLALTGTWGVLICKDLDFPALSRQYGKKKADLLLVPALDFDNDGWLHSRHAILRGIENGIPIARNGSQGQLTLSDSYGRVTSEAAAPTGGNVTLLGDLRPGIHSTLYTRLGDWFGWLSCLLVLVGLGTLRLGRRT